MLVILATQEILIWAAAQRPFENKEPSSHDAMMCQGSYPSEEPFPIAGTSSTSQLGFGLIASTSIGALA